jgi:hypothetical protein
MRTLILSTTGKALGVSSRVLPYMLPPRLFLPVLLFTFIDLRHAPYHLAAF